jgi:hypothetical protein
LQSIALIIFCSLIGHDLPKLANPTESGFAVALSSLPSRPPQFRQPQGRKIRAKKAAINTHLKCWPDETGIGYFVDTLLRQKADVQIPDLCLALKPASNTISSSSSGSYTLIYAPA